MLQSEPEFSVRSSQTTATRARFVAADSLASLGFDTLQSITSALVH